MSDELRRGVAKVRELATGREEDVPLPASLQEEETR